MAGLVKKLGEIVGKSPAALGEHTAASLGAQPSTWKHLAITTGITVAATEVFSRSEHLTKRAFDFGEWVVTKTASVITYPIRAPYRAYQNWRHPKPAYEAPETLSGASGDSHSDPAASKPGKLKPDAAVKSVESVGSAAALKRRLDVMEHKLEDIAVTGKATSHALRGIEKHLRIDSKHGNKPVHHPHRHAASRVKV